MGCLLVRPGAWNLQAEATSAKSWYHTKSWYHFPSSSGDRLDVSAHTGCARAGSRSAWLTLLFTLPLRCHVQALAPPCLARCPWHCTAAIAGFLHASVNCTSGTANLLGKLQPTLLEVTDGIGSELPSLGDSSLANDVLIIKSSPLREELPLPANPNSK